MVSEERKCPYCGRVIPIDAIACPYCAKKFYEYDKGLEKKHSGLATASLILGIIGIATIWLTFIPVIAFLYFFIHIPLGILTIIFGGISYSKTLDKWGLSGVILGTLSLVIGFIGFVVAVYIYVTTI